MLPEDLSKDVGDLSHGGTRGKRDLHRVEEIVLGPGGVLDGGKS
jgi:hypothetical protein